MYSCKAVGATYGNDRGFRLVIVSRGWAEGRRPGRRAAQPVGAAGARPGRYKPAANAPWPHGIDF